MFLFGSSPYGGLFYMDAMRGCRKDAVVSLLRYNGVRNVDIRTQSSKGGGEDENGIVGMVYIY